MRVKSFLKGIVMFEATMTYIKKYGRPALKSWCAKESPKVLPIDTVWPCKRKGFL